MRSYGDDESSEDDDDKPRLRRDRDGFLKREDRQYEFDCPECDANNPWPDGFADQDEVECHYCGMGLRVTFAERGRLKFKVL